MRMRACARRHHVRARVHRVPSVLWGTAASHVLLLHVLHVLHLLHLLHVLLLLLLRIARWRPITWWHASHTHRHLRAHSTDLMVTPTTSKQPAGHT